MLTEREREEKENKETNGGEKSEREEKENKETKGGDKEWNGRKRK